MTIKKWLVEMEDTTTIVFDSEEAYTGFCQQHGYQTTKHIMIGENGESVKEYKTTRDNWKFVKSNKFADNPNHGIWLQV